MKEIYKKIILGVIYLSIVFVLDKSLINDIGTFIFCFVVFFIPSIILHGKRFKIWRTLVPVLIVSLYLINFIPSTNNIFGSSNVCSGILCNFDDRPLYLITAYFIAIFVLALLEVRNFIQKKMAEKELKAKGK